MLASRAENPLDQAAVAGLQIELTRASTRTTARSRCVWSVCTGWASSCLLIRLKRKRAENTNGVGLLLERREIEESRRSAVDE